MAQQIIAHHSTTGDTLYALVRIQEGDVWDGATTVPYVTVDLGTYAIPMTEQGTASRTYTTDFPATLSSGQMVRVSVYVQAGGSPAEGDTLVTSYDVTWKDGVLGSAINFTIEDGVLLLLTRLGQAFDPFATPITIAEAIAAVQTRANQIDATTEPLPKYVRLLTRSDSGIATDHAVELAVINSDQGSGPGTYDNTTDSLQATNRAGTASAVWDAQTVDHEVADSFGERLIVGANAAVNADGWLAGIDAKIGTPATNLAAEIEAVPTVVWESLVNDLDDVPGSFGAAIAAMGGTSDANIVSISGSTVAADKLAAHAQVVVKIIVGPGSTSTSIVLHSTTGVDGGVPPSQSDTFGGNTNNRVLLIKTGALKYQACEITDYDGTNPFVLTVTGFTGAPLAGVEAVIA